jgi:uncharacterized protein with HEPN domain
MLKSTRNYLCHMRDEAEFLSRMTAGLTKESFVADETLTRAAVRSLEIMGEAAKQLPDDFCKQNGDIPWQAICGMRDRLIHGYVTVNYNVVWDTISSKVPELLIRLRQLINAPES